MQLNKFDCICPASIANERNIRAVIASGEISIFLGRVWKNDERRGTAVTHGLSGSGRIDFSANSPYTILGCHAAYASQ
jgi:hypothetical protein